MAGAEDAPLVAETDGDEGVVHEEPASGIFDLQGAVAAGGLHEAHVEAGGAGERGKDGVDLAMNQINVRKKAEEKKTEESKDHEKSE